MLHDIEIMRTGTFTATNGKPYTFTEEDLGRIAASYDPAFHEAPATIGHPEDNKPAYGWVKALKAVGGKLTASLDLAPEFMEAIRQGLFKKRSASLYPDLDGKGPYLRHVAFLGAMPPAIKALADINLNDDGREHLTIEFTEKEKKKMNWKDLFKKAVDEMPENGTSIVLPVQPPQQPPVSFSEEEVRAREQKAAEKAAREARERTLAEFAEREAVREKEARKKAIKARIEALQEKGKITPAMVKTGLVQFADGLDAKAVIEFSEGKKETPSEWFLNFLESLPKAVEFGEVSGKDKDIGTQGNAAAKLNALVGEKLKADPTMSYAVAFSEVQREHPDLATEYMAEINP